MRLEYRLPLHEPLPLDRRFFTGKQIRLDGVEISWEVVENSLNEIRLAETGIQVKLYQGRADLPGAPGERVYRVARYLADRLLIDANSREMIDLSGFAAREPECFPESEEERRLLENPWRRVSLGLDIGYRLDAYGIDPESFADGFTHAEAYADYADALRVKHKRSSTLLCYRVLEHLFPDPQHPPKKVHPWSARVSKYANTLDPRYTPLFVEYLRRLRHHEVHVTAAKPDGVDHQGMKELARLLLKNPPPPGA
jgi:hypothetical protein